MLVSFPSYFAVNCSAVLYFSTSPLRKPLENLSTQTTVQQGLCTPVLHTNSVTQTHMHTQMPTLTTLPKQFVQIIMTPNRTLQKLIKNKAARK